MKITVWGINYAPETTGIGPCTTELCRFLAERGYEVRMVTAFPYYPQWRKSPKHRGRFSQTETLDGVRVHRSWHYVPSRVTALRRILHEASFVTTSFLRLLWVPKPDLLIVISPPLLLGAAAWLLCRLRATPFLFHVQDLQPDAAAGLGLLRNPMLLGALRGLERFAYKHARRVSGISPAMLQAFTSKGVPAAKQIFLPNPISPPDPAMLPSRGRFRQRHNFAPDQFLAVYSGNFGEKQGLDILLDAAWYLRDSRIQIVLCGDGCRRPRLEQRLRQGPLPNLTLLPLQTPELFPELMVDADLCLVPQQSGTGRFFFPSKLLTAFAYAKPVLAIADPESELVHLLDQNQCGRHLPPGRPELLADALRQAADDPIRLREMASAGRRYVQRFELQSVLSRFDHDIQSLLNHGFRSAPALAQKAA